MNDGKQYKPDKDMKDWKEEFDTFWRSAIKICGHKGTDPIYRLEKGIGDFEAFISDLLAKRDAELREIIEERRKQVDCMDVDASEKDGYNQALNDVLEITKALAYGLEIEKGKHD